MKESTTFYPNPIIVLILANLQYKFLAMTYPYRDFTKIHIYGLQAVSLTINAFNLARFTQRIPKLWQFELSMVAHLFFQ